MAVVARTGTEIRLTVLGDGPDRARLQRRAARAIGDDAVHFTGALDDLELPAANGAADLFCMPSPAELQCLAALEAMAAGLPVVGAAGGALPESIGAAGRLYRPGDVDTLAGILGHLAHAPQELDDLRRMAVEVAGEHDSAVTTGRFVALYGEIGGRPVEGSPR